MDLCHQLLHFGHHHYGGKRGFLEGVIWDLVNSLRVVRLDPWGKKKRKKKKGIYLWLYQLASDVFLNGMLGYFFRFIQS